MALRLPNVLEACEGSKSSSRQTGQAQLGPPRLVKAAKAAKAVAEAEAAQAASQQTEEVADTVEAVATAAEVAPAATLVEAEKLTDVGPIKEAPPAAAARVNATIVEAAQKEPEPPPTEKAPAAPIAKPFAAVVDRSRVRPDMLYHDTPAPCRRSAKTINSDPRCARHAWRTAVDASSSWYVSPGDDPSTARGTPSLYIPARTATVGQATSTSASGRLSATAPALSTSRTPQ